jgi:hypothetical protein
VRSLVLVRPAMTAKQIAMPLAVIMKDLRRPIPSMRRTERMEHSAYSRPPMAATKCDILELRLKDFWRI